MLFISVALAGFGGSDAGWLWGWLSPPEARQPAPRAVGASSSQATSTRAPRPVLKPLASQACGSRTEVSVTGVRSTLGMGPGTPQDDRVKAPIRRKMGQLKHCYDQALAHDPTLGGRVEVRWRIEDGRARDVRASSTLDPDFVACVTSKVERWSFDAALTTDVHWPFVFHPIDARALDPLAIP